MSADHDLLIPFKVADSLTLLDAARAFDHAVGRTIDAGEPEGKVRCLVSEAKKLSIIQHEFYREFLASSPRGRDIEVGQVYNQSGVSACPYDKG